MTTWPLNENFGKRLDVLNTLMGGVKAEASRAKGRALAGDVQASQMLRWRASMLGMRTELLAIRDASSAAFVSYIRESFGNPTFDVAGAFNTVMSAMLDVGTEIAALSPAVTSGVSGTTDPVFTATQMTSLASALADLEATIG